MMTKKRRVLIIDDEPWGAEQMMRVLQKAGYAVETAKDGLDGIDRIDEFRPEVIVLDMFMPGPGGIVLLHELRSHTDLVKIPVVVCSNSAADIPIGSLEAYGVSRVLDKTTMAPEDVVTAVRGALL